VVLNEFGKPNLKAKWNKIFGRHNQSLILRLGDNVGNIRLSIHPLKQIRPHEEVIPDLLKTLKEDMRRTGYQRDPLIVDARTLVALDGMHRLAALRALGAKFAMCADCDYLSDSVKLERWLRYVIAPSRGFVKRTVKEFKMEQCSNFREAISLVESRRSRIALLSSRESYVQRLANKGTDDCCVASSIFSAYQQIKKFDKLCTKYNLQIRFASANEERRIFSSESVYLLYPLPISKVDVLSAAKSSKVFPFKTTRHTVPVRPMGVYFPIKALKSSTREDCIKALREIIKLSKVEISSRNLWYEGRQYGEPLAIFRKRV